MLFKNFMRELGGSVSKLLSIIIIAAVAVMMFTAFQALGSNGERIYTDFFDNSNVADYWISGSRLDMNDCRILQRLDFVNDIQCRNSVSAESFDDSDILLTVYGVNEFNINIPYIKEGDYPHNPSEMMLSNAFAEANGIKVGDEYEMLINNDKFTMTVCALIKSPEFLGTSLDSLENDGFAYVSEKSLESFGEKNVYSQFLITVTDKYSDAQIKNMISDALGKKVSNILSLEDNTGAYTMAETVNIIKSSTTALPIIFFLVAALIMFGTMTRMVENSRGTIGTLKALGYSDRVIQIYFLAYAFIVAAAGYMLGAALSSFVFNKPLCNLVFGMLYDSPPFTVVPNYQSLIIAPVLVMLFCVGTAYKVTQKSLSENPAQCMRPKPPKTAKKIFPERIPFLWNHLGFNKKYIIRGMFAGKIRPIICIFGVAGCMMLILTSFGMNDSTNLYLDDTMYRLNTYDISADFKQGIGTSDCRHIETLRAVDAVQYEMTTQGSAYTEDKKESTAVFVEEDVLKYKRIDQESSGDTALPKSSVIISKDLSDKLGVSAGNIISMDTADGKTFELQINSVSPNVYGIMISKKMWRSLGESFVPTTAYIKTTDINTVLQDLEALDIIDDFQTKDEMIAESAEPVQSIMSIVYVFIIFGGILAVVVLYNLGIMNFFEQTRNLATLMVLGFRPKEIKALQLTDSIIFTAMGIIAGIPLGVMMTTLMMSTMGDMNFDVYISPLSYIISSGFTLMFAILVNGILSKKMKKIDMLGALKSVE